MAVTHPSVTVVADGGLGIVPADVVMSHDHLHGVKACAERVPRSTSPPKRGT
jgi:hypothetical protein